MGVELSLTNCRVFGQDESLDTILVSSGRIADITDGMAMGARRIIDLSGRLVIPGFIDSHTHLLTIGLSETRLDLSGCGSREEAVSKTREYSSRSGASVIVGYGWDETKWGEKDYLSREDIDMIGKPVILYRKDMHMAVVNGKVLSAIGEVSRDGLLKEGDMDRIGSLAEPGTNELINAYKKGAEKAASVGITTVRDIMSTQVADTIKPLPLPVRVFRTIYGRSLDNRPMSDENSWGVKIFLDGSVGSGTAAHEGWPLDNMKFSREELDSTLSSYWKSGLQVAMHAIGEIATSSAVTALRNQKGWIRNSIEHFEFVESEILDEISPSTVISSQPNFLQWSGNGGLYQNKMGNEWFGRDNPFREFLDRGFRLAFGSDSMPIGPSLGIGYAVNSPHGSQRISPVEAVRTYTAGGAYLLHEENISGMLRPGFRADMAVFDENYLRDAVNIGMKKPYMTFLGGVVTFSRDPGTAEKHFHFP